MVTFKCTNRYQSPLGNPTIKCGQDGKWSQVQFTCQSVCKAPPAFSGANMFIGEDKLESADSDFYGVGNIVTYQCKPGHYTRNNKVLKAECKSDGTWKHSNFGKCKPGCGLTDADISKIENSRLVGSGKHFRKPGRNIKFYEIRGAAHFLCRRGYKAINKKTGRMGRSPTIRCTTSGWSEPKTTCVKINRGRNHRLGRPVSGN